MSELPKNRDDVDGHHSSSQGGIIIIGGGVGPLAGVKCHEVIIDNTDATTDQDHIDTVLLTRASICSRQAFLNSGGVGENPGGAMARTFMTGLRMAEGTGEGFAFGVPCNCFHAPSIWDAFFEESQRLISSSKLHAQVFHMLEETMALVQRSAHVHAKKIGDSNHDPSRPSPTTYRVGVLTTEGSRAARLWEGAVPPVVAADGAEPLKIEIVHVPEEEQKLITSAIYDADFGIKSVTPVSERARDNCLRAARWLQQRGVDCIVLGCSELPLALTESFLDDIFLIDPVVVLSRALIRATHPDKLKKRLGYDTGL